MFPAEKGAVLLGRAVPEIEREQFGERIALLLEQSQRVESLGREVEGDPVVPGEIIEE